MQIGKLLSGALLAAFLWAASASAQGVEGGQIDTFGDGTTQGWFAGLGAPHPAPPVNVGTGGPAGADDNFLLLTATGGGGPGSRLSVLNESQWTGDYHDIRGIRLDVNNFGPSEVALRLVLENPMFAPPTDVAFSTDAVLLAPGAGWQTIEFPILGGLTVGLGDLETLLDNVTAIRFYHSPEPNFPNPVFPIPTINVQLGVDNIEALAVPEPSTFLAMGLGLPGLCSSLRARRSRRLPCR